MPTNSESLNRELFRLLSKYKPKPLDAEGKATPIPDEADIFKFEFTKDGEEYGTVYVTLDEDRVLTVYFGDDVSDSPGDKTPGLDYDDTWSGLLHQLSAWRMTKGLRGFKTQNKDRVGDDMARRNHMRNKDKIAEGYYPMGKRASYSDAVPSVKIVIEHSRTIEEGEQRYRNINRIFLENQAGERYLLDTKKPGIARVYARHIAEGGRVNDDRWDHIGSLCEEYSKMAGFVRATRNGQFNESAQALVNEGLEHYQSLRESLSRMTGKRGYNAYFESWTPSLMETEGEENNLNELFVQETLDPRIESVMPILNRIHKKVSESVVDKEIDKLAEWADSLTEAEGESLTSNNPIGIPESLDQHSPVTQAITRRILMQHPDLLQKYGPEKVGDAIDSVAEFVGDVEEIGSSDVSGWVKQVVQSLDDHQGVAEGSENFTITQKNDHSYPGSIQVVITDKSTGKQTVIAGDPRKIKQQIKQEFGIDYNFGKQGVAEAVWDRPSQSYVPRDGRTFGQTNHPREEHCDACGAATGHAGPGEDSNVDDEGNVYCDDCYADQKGVAEGYGEDDGIHLGAKVYHKEHQSGEPFKVAKIIDDQRVGVIDDYGNKKVMFINQLVPAQGVADDGRKQQFRGTGNAGMPRTDDDGNVLEQGVSEGESTTQKYEMMMRNGQVKKFIAKDDADAKRIAAGHGAKSVIRLRGGVPAGKVSEQGVAEDLDANQKRVGQLGPTEKVKNNNIGKLVGANENFINTVDQAVVSEDEDRPYVCVHAKKGKCEVKASSSYAAAQKAAQKWGLKGTAGIDAYLADVEHDASTLEESTDELARILQIMNHKR